jgi:hypothetical protein
MENFDEKQSSTPRNSGNNKRKNQKKSLNRFIMPIGIGLVCVLLIACVAVAYSNGLFGSNDPTTPITEPPTDAPTEAPTDPMPEINAAAEKLIA